MWAVISLTRCCAPVAGIDDPALQSALDRLADADLLISEGAGSQANYRFKHALIQDAAYESLLKSRRQVLHRRAAEILVGQPEPAAQPSRKSSPIISPRPASTNSRSNGGARRAIKPCAARHSRRRSPISARRSPWRTSLAAAVLTPRAASTTAESQLAEKLQASLGRAMMWSRGFGSDESKTAFARCARRSRRELATRASDLTPYYGLFVGSVLRGELGLAKETAESFLSEAENEGANNGGVGRAAQRRHGAPLAGRFHRRTYSNSRRR